MARQRPWLPVGVALVAAAGIAALALTWPSGDDAAGDDEPVGASTTVDPDAPVVVASTVTDDPVDLAGLVAASDLVLVGVVDAVERGQPIAVAADDASGEGTPVAESALATVVVDEVLVGDDPGPTVLVEEEGWLADGRRISLDGVAPTEVGDRGIWFLVDTGDPDEAAWVTVGRVGRWTERDGVLVGPLLDIPLAIDLQDRPLADVVADILALDPTSTTTATTAP